MLLDTEPALPKCAMVIIEIKVIYQTAGDMHAMMAFIDKNPKLKTDSNMLQCNREINMFIKHDFLCMM